MEHNSIIDALIHSASRYDGIKSERNDSKTPSVVHVSGKTFVLTVGDAPSAQDEITSLAGVLLSSGRQFTEAQHALERILSYARLTYTQDLRLLRLASESQIDSAEDAFAAIEENDDLIDDAEQLIAALVRVKPSDFDTALRFLADRES